MCAHMYVGLVVSHYTKNGWKLLGENKDEDGDQESEATSQGSKQPANKTMAAKPGQMSTNKSSKKSESSESRQATAEDVSPSMILEKKTFMWDPIVDNLLVFPPGTSMHADVNVAAGRVVLQDRSSCLPALALCPIPAGTLAIDACAAPGEYLGTRAHGLS
jgi:16S rRNA C967 or C1407 C5-methylase (RsmB/RsmF family)